MPKEKGQVVAVLNEVMLEQPSMVFLEKTKLTELLAQLH